MTDGPNPSQKRRTVCNSIEHQAAWPKRETLRYPDVLPKWSLEEDWRLLEGCRQLKPCACKVVGQWHASSLNAELHRNQLGSGFPASKEPRSSAEQSANIGKEALKSDMRSCRTLIGTCRQALNVSSLPFRKEGRNQRCRHVTRKRPGAWRLDKTFQLLKSNLQGVVRNASAEKALRRLLARQSFVEYA